MKATEIKTIEIPAPKVILKGDWGGLVYAISTDFVTVDKHEKAVEKEIERIEEEYGKKNHWSVSLRFVKKETVLSNEHVPNTIHNSGNIGKKERCEEANHD